MYFSFNLLHLPTEPVPVAVGGPVASRLTVVKCFVWSAGSDGLIKAGSDDRDEQRRKMRGFWWRSHRKDGGASITAIPWSLCDAQRW